jgi:F-type H+-transporting ATPase subunit b
MLDFSVTLIITIINIIILYFILKKILFKPVTKFMADRAKRIQDSIDQAHRDKARAQKVLEEYETNLRNATEEVVDILKIAREDANIQAEQIINEGKTEAANIIAAAHKQIEAEHQAALIKFKLEAAALVMAASSKLSAREFSGDDNKRYVNMLLDELAVKKGRT